MRVEGMDEQLGFERLEVWQGAVRFDKLIARMQNFMMEPDLATAGKDIVKMCRMLSGLRRTALGTL